MEKLYASTTSSVVTSGSTGAGAGASTSVKLLIAPTLCSGAPAIALAGPRLRRLQSCGARLLLQSCSTGALALAQASGTKVSASVSNAPLTLRAQKRSPGVLHAQSSHTVLPQSPAVQEKSLHVGKELCKPLSLSSACPDAAR